MKICLLTSRLTSRPTNGGELCTLRLAQGLAQAGHEVVAVGLGSYQESDAPMPGRATQIDTRLAGPEVRPFGKRPLLLRLVLVGLALACGRPISTLPLQARAISRQVRRQLQQAMSDDGVTGLVVDHLQSLVWVSRQLRHLPAPMVVLHNLESAGYLERAAGHPGRGPKAMLARWLLRREARLMAALEQQVLRRASAVACLSEDDAVALSTMAAACGSRVPVQTLPGYPLHLPGASNATAGPAAGGEGLAPHEVRQRIARLPAGHRRIGLLGTWTWAPNRAALQWFLHEVQPLLPADCQVVLAGAGLEDVPLPARALALGCIARVASFYESVDVVAIPSVCGSGVHEKAIEALGSGRRVVATRHALRGLLPELPEMVQVVDDAEAFARACAQAVPARAGELATACQAWTEQRQAAYRRALADCVAAMAAAPCHPSPAGTRHDRGLGTMLSHGPDLPRA